MHIAKQTLLPTAKPVPSHRHRNRHIDTDHAHLNSPRKFTRYIAITGEATHAIAKLVGVDQIYRLREIFDTHTAQHGPKNFFFIDAHLRCDMVKQSATHPKPFFASRTRIFGVKRAAVDQKLGTFFSALLDITGDALVRDRGDDGAHLCREVSAVEHFQSLGALDQFGHDAFRNIAHQHRHADRHTTLAG